METEKFDVVILGAGAAGLMAAIEAGKRKRTVCILEHNSKVGKKIRISGGGRCNFTNIYTEYKNFISNNPHFCKSALARFGPWDIISRLAEAEIPYHEKKLGQQFCDRSAQDVVDYLLAECKKQSVKIYFNTKFESISKKDDLFLVKTNEFLITSESFIAASGALSIPKIGATDIGYKIARKFGHKIVVPRAGLVPFLLGPKDMNELFDLKGISIDSVVSIGKTSFRENILFTHKGLSGPAILQISSYWQKGQSIFINLLPDQNIIIEIEKLRQSDPKRTVKAYLSEFLVKRFVQYFLEKYNIPEKVSDLSKKDFKHLDGLHHWEIVPIDTEGFAKAEVTVGGVDTNDISSKTMESKKTKSLFFIGEVLDVTGHLGGHNFQWAWASGYVAGQYA